MKTKTRVSSEFPCFRNKYSIPLLWCQVVESKNISTMIVVDMENAWVLVKKRVAVDMEKACTLVKKRWFQAKLENTNEV